MTTTPAPSRPAGLITYDGLPISAGGAHAIRIARRERIWDEIHTFLRLFTDYVQPEEIKLIAYEDDTVDAAFLSEALAATSSSFGDPHRRLQTTSVDGTYRQYVNEWPLEPSQLGESLALLGEHEAPAGHNLGGPLLLTVLTRFQFKDADSGTLFPHQGRKTYGDQEAERGTWLGESHAYLRLGGRSTCNVFFSLPFPEPTPDVIEYVASVSASLPFRLSSKHWSRWQLNRAGTHYYRRRLMMPTTVG